MAAGSKRKLPGTGSGDSKHPSSSQDAPAAHRLPADVRERIMSFFPSDYDTSQQPRPNPPAPRSQKEATMASEPSEQQIANLQEFCGMDRPTAVRYLKAKRNDTDAAAIAYFEGEDIGQAEAGNTWDESVFSADREGNAPAGQHSEQAGGERNIRSLAAPTAPNSRAASPGKTWSNQQPSSQAEQDEMMQAAMAESMASSQHLPFQQETGTVSASGQETSRQQFGPATKQRYEEASWAVVPHSTFSGEVVPDVEAEQRRNREGEPRMLKQIPEGDYLSSFLTICHAIAGVREKMLMRCSVQAGYGQGEDWWKGQPIRMPQIVHTESGRPVSPSADRSEDLVAEVQRLMACLDASERSYVSPGALTQTESIRDESVAITKSRTLLEHFVQQWAMAATTLSGEDVSGMFNMKTGGNAISDDGDNLLFELKANPAEGETVGLSELLDTFFWSSDPAQDPKYIERPADVFTIRLANAKQAATQLQVEVPAEMHLDKYLKENVGATSGVREQISQNRTRIKKLAEIEKKLSTWQHPKKGEQIEARALLSHTYGHFSGKNREEAKQKDTQANGIGPSDEDETPAPPHYKDIAARLEKTIKSIDSKLSVLASEKEKTQKAIADLSRNPLPELDGKQAHRYTLRGVATKPQVTYVLLSKPEDEDDQVEGEGEDTTMGGATDEDESTPEGMAWWRMEYEVLANGSARVTKSRCPDYDVLRAAELEWRECLLIYASDEVNDVALYDPALPDGLKRFVQEDNALFRAELEEAKQNAQPPAYSFGKDEENKMMSDIPRQSIEPRGSMDSLRAEGGDDVGGNAEGRVAQPDYGTDAFMDRDGFGLGPIKSGQYQATGDDAPVHEIRLSPPPAGEGHGGEHVEMSEKSHGGNALVKEMRVGAEEDRRDEEMGGAESQK